MVHGCDLSSLHRMKKFIYLSLIGIVLQLSAASQGNNPCGKSWSNWTNVWNGQNAQVDYQLEFPSKSCGCGWKYVRIRHTFPHRTFVKIWLEGQDCDGKAMTSSFEAETVGGEISGDQGDWHSFKSVSGVAKVEIEYEDGGKKVKIVTTRSGTARYINGMSEKDYNQQQQQKSTTSSPTSTPKPAGGTTNNSSSTNTTRTNSSTTTSSASQRQAQSAEQQRLQREEASRKQQEAERRQREEAIRQNELRYQAQLQEITRKSEARAERDAAIMDGFAGIVSIIQKNKAERGLREDASKRSSKLSEYQKKLAEGGYELIDCPHCDLDGFDRCGQCRGKGTIKCNICNGEAGKSCSGCRGTGKKGYGPYQVACFTCSGTGARKCLPCGNEGSNICFLCDGRGEDQCVHCNGTGKVLERVSKPPASNYSNRTTTTSYQTSDNYDSNPSTYEKNSLTQEEQDMKAAIEEATNFLKKNKTKPGVKSTASGLQYQVLKPGNGRRIKLGDTISYHVRYSDIQGNVLYNSAWEKQPTKHVYTVFPKIRPFAMEAFTMLHVGSHYKFFVGSNFAYFEQEILASKGVNMQAGAALIVDYELLSAKRPVEEILKEEKRIDSMLVKSIRPQLVKSYNKVKEDSLFCITLSRSFEEEKRTELWVETAILYREADGFYPTDSYGSDILYNINASGSVYAIFYIASPSDYKNTLIELESKAKSLGIKVVKEKKIKYENERPRKKLTGEDFWNKF